MESRIRYAQGPAHAQLLNLPLHIRVKYLNFKFFHTFFQTDTFAAVYKKLTGKDVNFEFPEPYL